MTVKEMVVLDDYRDKYENAYIERRDGILQIQLHTGGEEFRNNATAHTELVDLFSNVAADHGNRIVILTGTGNAFGDKLKPEGFGGVLDGDGVARVHYEGRKIMENVLAVEAPMIAAINGPMTMLPPFALTCDITLCSENATFSDFVHFQMNGTVPGDGVQTVWEELLGVNRARYFLLTGQELDSQAAMNLGVVNEVLPREKLLARAWELAEDLNKRAHHVLRYSRLILTDRYRRAMRDSVAFGYGMQWLGIKTS